MRIIFDTKVINAGDMSEATLTSSVTDLSSMWGFSVMSVYTGSPVGSLQLQVSNDGTTWVALGSATAISAAGSVMYNLTDVAYLYARLLYTKTSGTGALTCHLVGKGV